MAGPPTGNKHVQAFVAAFLLFRAAAAAGAPALLHHDLAVTVDEEIRSLTGTDTMTVDPGGGTLLSFFLAPGARVNSVAVAGKPVSFTFRDGKLDVPVPGDAGGEKMTATVAYEAVFSDPVPENVIGAEDPGFGAAGILLPRGVFLSEEAGWYPAMPGSRPTFRLRVEARKGIEAVTAGRLLSRATTAGSTVSEWEIDQPLEGIALSAGDYRVREGHFGKIPVYTYFFPDDDPLSETFLTATVRYLDLYSKLFGPYPFPKFAVVENFFPTGYGFPSYTLLGSTVLRLPFIVETSLGHEIAHSWWGNGVLVDYSRGNWSEGLTTYVADHLGRERASPEEGRAYRMKLLQDYATLVPPPLDFPLREFKGRNSPASRAVGYGKGAMVFHMARRRAGDEAFARGLRAVARDRLFAAVSWDDFVQAFGRESSVDLSSFLRQWVDRSGAPVLALKDVKADREGRRWRVTGRLVQEGVLYDLKIPLRLETEGARVEAVVSLRGEDALFRLSADARPLRLIADPEVDVFRRLDPSEIPPSVNGIRGSTRLLVVSAKGLSPDILEASKVLLAALGKEDAAVVREEETPPSLLAGRDVLYLGLPEGKGYLPPFPRGLAVTPGSFTLEGKRFSSPSDALFAALPHPTDGTRVAALFLPFSPSAALSAAGKIPHYGKYGYLAFSDGTNKAKGFWPATASPTVHLFGREKTR